jgi:LacI family transcriptional regulator
VSSRKTQLDSSSVPAAKSARRSGLRVLVVTEFHRNIGRQLIRGLTAYSNQYGPWEFVCDRTVTHAQPGLLRRFRPLDGAIVQATHPEPLAELHNSGVPLVVAQEIDADGILQVIPDLEAVGHLAADHLLGLGLRHLAFWKAGKWSPYFSKTWERVLQARADEAGVDLHVYRRMGQNLEGTPRARKWLGRLPKPIGIFARSDAEAQGLAATCWEEGIHVPDEIALLGTENDVELCELSHPPLSSIDQNFQEVGFQAAGLLDRMMHGQVVEPRTIRVPPNPVVVRQSTQMLAVKDANVAAAIRVIRQQACDGIDVEGVAREVAVPRRTLEAAFRRNLNSTIHEQIVRARVERAKRLLVTTDLDMTALAISAGFNSRTRLSISFRKFAGTTPTAYREAHSGFQKLRHS